MNMQSELKNSKEIIAYLAKQFPNCFTIEGDAKPLKIGIFQDVVARMAIDEQFSKTKLRVALRTYTANWRYLHCLKDGAYRVDLDGNQCDVITKEQAEHASLQLKESKEKVRAKRQIESSSKSTQSEITKTSKKPNQPDNAKKLTVADKNGSDRNKPTLSMVNKDQLKVGLSVKIMLGSKPVPATISGIEKEHIKVKIASGMELTVTANHILI